MLTGLYFDANTIANAMPGSEFCEVVKRCALITWIFMHWMRQPNQSQSAAAQASLCQHKHSCVSGSESSLLCRPIKNKYRDFVGEIASFAIPDSIGTSDANNGRGRSITPLSCR